MRVRARVEFRKTLKKNRRKKKEERRKKKDCSSDWVRRCVGKKKVFVLG